MSGNFREHYHTQEQREGLYMRINLTKPKSTSLGPASEERAMHFSTWLVKE